jgi:hypothetical protein
MLLLIVPSTKKIYSRFLVFNTVQVVGRMADAYRSKAHLSVLTLDCTRLHVQPTDPWFLQS